MGGELAISAKTHFCHTELDVGLQGADCRQRGRGHPRARDERGALGCEPSGWVAEGQCELRGAQHGQRWPPGHVRRRKISVKRGSRK